MKKFRGKRRYFRNLRKATAVEQYDLNFGNEGWFDGWHTHLDFFGLGNTSFKVRREHIKAHLALYENLLEKLDTYDKPYQSWIELNNEDAGLDAVYIHTPNPNADNFPLKIENINWHCVVPRCLWDLIDMKELNVGFYNTEANSCYIIQAKGIKLLTD
ncbi:hypothetical protein AB1L05_11935 [Cytobacillus horneckiae]|uniref:hypothetical protein n=1 Tax=Cytobacillus horneckiae TaxID=549687 RepID=UPI0039A1A252